jgi:CO/xanthine dehydrogenase FAD-binding subunit
MLALDASIEIHTHNEKPKKMKLGDWLPFRGDITRGKLITLVSFELNEYFSYEYIARSPADLPIVCAAVAKWNSGRTRLALGGWGTSPILAFDGPNSDGIEVASKDAYSEAEDEWASAEYRREMARILSIRCLNRIKP